MWYSYVLASPQGVKEAVVSATHKSTIQSGAHCFRGSGQTVGGTQRTVGRAGGGFGVGGLLGRDHQPTAELRR